MTRPKKASKGSKRSAPPPRREERLPRGLYAVAALGLVAIVALGALLWLRGGDDVSTALRAGDPGPVHVHGLGIDPADGALFVATHTGLYRVEAGERRAKRVGGRLQDTMGFTVVRRNHFLGSGHPDLTEAREKGLPPHLGLIQSTDAGESWTPVSLLGEADFHVLRFARERVYGYDASNDRLLVSADGGRTWTELERPAPLIDLVVDASEADGLIGATPEGLFESRDGGESWSRKNDAVGLLAWPERHRLY